MKGHFFPLTQEFLDSIPNKKLGISYCDQSPLQILDLYLPDAHFPRPCPVIVHTHGGAFANGDQRENNAMPMLRGLTRGYAVASVQYRRSREALFPAQIYDVKAAVRYLRANAETFGLDPERFASWGPSSGGWLASMLGVTADNPAFEDRTMGNGQYSSAVQAVVDWCGPCGGFLEMDPAFRASGLGKADHNEADSPESRFMGRRITEIPELVRLASPISYVHPDMPPVYIMHGSADEVVPVEQSIAFSEAIERSVGKDKVKLNIVPGKLHHGDPWYDEPWVAESCLDFLDSVLK